MKIPRRATWSRSLGRSFTAIGRQAVQAGNAALVQALKATAQPKARPKARPKIKPTLLALTLPKPKVTQSKASTGTRPKAKSARRPATTDRWTTGAAVGPGGTRRWRLYTPPGVQPGERLPLLVLLHGCKQDASAIAASTGLPQLAARERFLLLCPEQDRLANPQGCWNWYDTDHGRAQAEADLVLLAIDQVCRLRRADRARVVVVGLSAGAGLAALLAVRHPARLAGVVMHSGVPPGTAHSTLTALAAMRGRRSTAALGAPPAGGWPPLLVIHGSLDGVVSPRNAEAAALAWAEASGARASTPRRVQRGQRHAMLVTDYKQRGRTVATLALVQGLSHAWSGGAAGLPFSDPKGPDAARMAWAFAQKQFTLRAA